MVNAEREVLQAALLERARHGDSVALGELIGTVEPLLKVIARRAPSEQREDLVQAMRTELVRRFEHHVWAYTRRKPPMPYAISAMLDARKAATDQFRRDHRQKRTGHQVPQDDVEDLHVTPDPDLEDVLDHVWDASVVLSPTESVLVGSYYGLDGQRVRTAREIGRELGIGEATVRTWISRAIAKLRDQLQKIHPPGD